MGYEVYNPVREIDKKTSWDDALVICLSELSYCDYIYFQPDWWLSKGSKMEMEEAVTLKIDMLNDGYKIKSVYKFIKDGYE
jgi:hypothetical protein